MTAASRQMHRKRIRRLARCPDCNSEVLVRSASNAAALDAKVFHDHTCPWFNTRAAGEPFREFRILEPLGDNQ